MITLKTLPKATAQQVFDQVATHLLTQKRKSKLKSDPLECAYRGKGSLKCAAGCLISDEEYNPAMEGNGWCRLIREKIAPSKHEQLIYSLQIIHDTHPVNEWETKLKWIAEINKLKWKFN
jgi:hypothetical protein